MSQSEPVTTSWSTKTHWIIAITALCLLLAALSGYFYHRYQMNRLSSQYLRLIVSGPSVIHLDTINRFEIKTLTIEGKPVAAQIQFLARKSSSESILEYHENVPEEGLLDIVVDSATLSRANLGEKPNDWIEISIQASCLAQTETFSAKIPIAPNQYLTQLKTNKIGYSQDEPIEVWGQVRQNDTLRPCSLGKNASNSTVTRKTDAQCAKVAASIQVFSQPINSLSQGRVTVQTASLGQKGQRCPQPLSFYGLQWKLPSPDVLSEGVSRPSTGTNLPTETNGSADSAAPKLDGSSFNLYELSLQSSIPAVLKSRQYAFRYSARPSERSSFANDPTPNDPTPNVPAGNVPAPNVPAPNVPAPNVPAATLENQQKAERLESSDPNNLVEFFPTEATVEQPEESALELVFLPEGGRIIADLENRVFLAAVKGGRPQRLRGQILDGNGKIAALVETNSLGIGSFDFFPRFNTPYWFVPLEETSTVGLLGSSPDDKFNRSKQDQNSSRNPDAGANSDLGALALPENQTVETIRRIPLPAVLRSSQFTLKGDRCVLSSDETALTFSIQTNQRHLPLVAEIEQRGIGLLRVPFFTKDVTTKVSMELPDSFNGFGKLTIYDYSSSRPIAAVERVVYRYSRQKYSLQTEKREDSLLVSLVPTSYYYQKNDRPTGQNTSKAVKDAAAFLTLTEPSKAMDFDFANLPSELYFHGMATLTCPLSLDKVAQAIYSPQAVFGESSYATIDESEGEKTPIRSDLSEKEAKKIRESQEMLLGLCRMAVPRSSDSNRIQSRVYPMVYDNFPDLQTRLKTILREYFSSTHQTLICATSVVLFLGIGLEFFVLLCWILGIQTGRKVHLLALGVCFSSVAIAVFLSYSPSNIVQAQNRFINYEPPLNLYENANSTASRKSKADFERLSVSQIQFLQEIETLYKMDWEESRNRKGTNGGTNGADQAFEQLGGEKPEDDFSIPRVFYCQSVEFSIPDSRNFDAQREQTSSPNASSDAKSEKNKESKGSGNRSDNSVADSATDSAAFLPIYSWKIPLKDIDSPNCWIRFDLSDTQTIQSFYQPINSKP